MSIHINRWTKEIFKRLDAFLVDNDHTDMGTANVNDHLEWVTSYQLKGKSYIYKINYSVDYPD